MNSAVKKVKAFWRINIDGKMLVLIVLAQMSQMKENVPLELAFKNIIPCCPYRYGCRINVEYNLEMLKQLD